MLAEISRWSTCNRNKTQTARGKHKNDEVSEISIRGFYQGFARYNVFLLLLGTCTYTV